MDKSSTSRTGSSAEVRSRPMSTFPVFLFRPPAFLRILLCVHLSAAAFAVAAASGNQDLLVGRWKCEIEYGSWAIERRTDGTFAKTGKMVERLGQPPKDFHVEGRWQLKGKEYIEIWDQVSPRSWSELKGSVRRAKVLLLEPNKFRRIQNDSPVFIETRIQSSGNGIGS